MLLIKILKKTIKFFIYLISPIFILILLVIYPFLKVRFSLQSSERIGEISTQMEVYLSEKKLDKKFDYFDIFILTDIVSNYTYISLLKKKVNIYPNFLTFPIYKILKLVGQKINFFNLFILNTKYEDSNFAIMQTNINLKPDDDFIAKGNRFLKKIGLPEDAKIICLIVRDNEYLKKKFPDSNYDYHDYRNCNIENFKEAINASTNRGYYVFRMGEIVKDELKINNEKFIDYSSKFRSDFLDVYLAYKCNFCITTSTGWDCVAAFTFRKPTLWTNYVPVGNLLTYSPNFLFSLKHHMNIQTKKYLNLKQISESLASYANSTWKYKKANIELKENTPKEIKDLTIEMIDRIEKKNKYTDEDEKLQKVFWDMYVKFFNINNVRKFETTYKINPYWCTSKRLYKDKIISRIGNNFLKDNRFLINE
tara:strand:- start:8264 stop:9529 length:1266 start_codon:yes stop_codon:yes gene_type:complete